MLPLIRRWTRPDMAIDLGTANTLVVVAGCGIVVNEPSVVALDRDSRQVLGRGAAIGRYAQQLLGRTPDGIIAERPIRHGVINDFELCETMLAHLIRKARKNAGGRKPRVVIAVPGGITAVERRAVFQSAVRAGAGLVYLIEESRAAAIGAALPIFEPRACMICDIGGGTTDVAVFSLGEVVASRSARAAGDDCDAAIVDYARRRLALRIGQPTAEQLKIEIGSAFPCEAETTAEIGGLDAVSGVPRRATVTSEEIRAALREPLEAIVGCVRHTFEQCPVELAADLSDAGLVLTGGGALLRGLDELMAEQLGIPVRLADDPLTNVARGAAVCLEHLGDWRRHLVTEDR